MIESLDRAGSEPALFAEGLPAPLSYGELAGHVHAVRRLLGRLPRPGFVFQFQGNTPEAIFGYLACLNEAIPLGLGEPSETARKRVIEHYSPTGLLLGASESGPPDYTLAGTESGVALWVRSDEQALTEAPHPDLALLLATSGSTGDAKFVRLSLSNLTANARSIASYLDLGPGERAMLSLPLHYSYGLSVVNSHLLSGGAIALTRHSFMRPEFWGRFAELGCTSFAGVPYMYETLRRLRINPAAHPSLRTLTQAGGRLAEEHVRHFHQLAERQRARLFVMYGQTEATARMAYLPPSMLPAKAGSIGQAIPGGELWLNPMDTGEQELCYRGANVMMGYATCQADLAKGDEMNGILATGDLAERDSDGLFRITGRRARFAKLFGKRINLASVELEAESRSGRRAAAADRGDRIRIYLEQALPSEAETIRLHTADWLSVPPATVEVATVAALPMTASGKKDYKALP